MPTIFLSYGRGDDESFARRLHDDLSERGFEVWFDRVSMPSRRLTFHHEIRDAIGACDRFLLVVGPRAVASDYVRQEWQFAWFDSEKPVTPVLRIGEYALIPDELKLLHCEDFREDSGYETHLKQLERILGDEPPKLGDLIGVPSLPAHYLSRTDRLVHLRDAVRAGLDSPICLGGAVTHPRSIHGITGSTKHLGMHGMGGIGKSFLANLLVHDRRVREAFPDGIVWVGLGTSPEIRRRMVDVHRALGGDGAIADEVEGKQKLINLLRNKATLLVLDDAWNRSDVDSFDVLGPRCRALVTTRDAGLLGAMNAISHPVELLSNEEALHLLAVSAGLEISALTADALEVLARCGRLPLAVALAGSMVRAGVPWIDLRDSLRDHALEFLEDSQSANPLHVNLWRMIEISVAALADDVQHRLAELAVFPPDEQVPDAAIATLWRQTGGLNPRQSRKLLVDLRKRSLLQLTHTGEAGSVGKCAIHDLIHDFCIRLARRQHGTETLLHDFLLSAYQRNAASWWRVPNDGYFFDHLRIHLVAAGRTAELVDLMQNLSWLETKAEVGLAFDIATDFKTALECMAPDSSDRKRVELLCSALRSDIQFIAEHPTTVFQCFWNRCWWYDSPQTGRHYEAPAGGWPPPSPPWEAGAPELCRLMERWKHEKEVRSPGFHWLRSHRPPDIYLGSRQRAVIHTPKVVGDGQSRRIRFSSDSLRVGEGSNWWSVETGIKLPSQPQPASEPSNSEDRLNHVSPDGQIVVELGETCSFRVLDSEGSVLATTSPLGLVRPPIPSHLSYMSEESLLKDTPATHAILANARIVFSADRSMFAVYGQANWSPFEQGHGYWGVWATTGKAIVPLQQFRYRVNDVVFSPDNRYVALAAGDPGDGLVDFEQGSFALWNLTSETLVVQLGLKGEAYTTGVMFSSTSDRVFAWGGVRDGDFDYGSARGYLGAWETANGRQLCLQEGGDWCLSCFSLPPRGSRFAAGLYDGRVGFGDLTSFEMELLTGHLGAVISVAFDPAGMLLASLGEDGTLRLLAPEESGSDPGRLQNHENPLVNVQFTNDGLRAVTRCSRHSVWLWDTRTGEVIAKPRPGGVVVLVGHPPVFYFDGKSLVVDGPTLIDTIDGKIISSPDKNSWERHEAVVVSHSGKVLARLRDDQIVEIAFSQGRELTVPLALPKPHHRAVAVFFSPDDRLLSTQYDPRGVTVYDVLTGRRRFSLSDAGPFLFSTDSRHILAAGAEPLRLYDAKSGVELAHQHLSAYWAHEALSPDGRFRATVSEGRVAIVEVGSPRQPARLEGHEPSETEFAFTRDPRFLLTRDGGWKILLWDLEKGEQMPPERWLEKVPNVGRGGTVIVSNPYTAEEILSIRDGSVSNAAFDRNCRRVFFVTGDGVTRIWDIELGTCSELSAQRLPVHAVAAGDPYYAVAAGQNTAIVDAATKQEVAWFPVAFDPNGENFATYPPFRLWAGGSSDRFYLFSLEGAVD